MYQSSKKAGGGAAVACVCLTIAGAGAAFAAIHHRYTQLREVIVTATMRSVPDLRLPGSATVLDARTLRAAGQQHFED
ncbi:MAG: hypothetical protein HKM03_00645, partial [Steroidobacteraceae bacterium]|nr:hypothetical protein [Steroidobacteraceae bacterium]